MSDNQTANTTNEQPLVVTTASGDTILMTKSTQALSEYRERDWTPKVLALILTIFYCFLQYKIITTIIDPSMREIVMRSFGTLDTLLVFVFGFYFGTSLSSEKKQRTIDKVLSKEKV